MAYEHFKIQPDLALLAQYEASTTGATIHDRNALRANYMGWCLLGEQAAADKAEQAMRRLMAAQLIR
jgi:hypothetical protein